MHSSKKLSSTLLLILGAMIWGTSFVAQKKGVAEIPPNSFNGLRTMLGCIVLLPVIYFKDKSAKAKGTFVKTDKKTLIKAGIICGVILCIAATAQTYGLVTADAGKAGFITALYIVIVPILGIFIGKRVTPAMWAAVALAITGLYFLCVKSTGTAKIGGGEIILFVCALVFSLHILAIDYYSPKVDGVKLSCFQFFVAGILNIIVMLIFEKPQISDIISCAFPIFYAGAMSCGVAYTLQIVAQKNIDPTVASLIMSLESLFALLAGIAFGEQPSSRELAGCVFMMLAIVLVQIPENSFKRLKR